MNGCRRPSFTAWIQRYLAENRRMRLTALILSMFFVTVCVPVLIILFLYAQHSANIIRSELSANMMLAARQLRNNLDYRLTQVEESALSILTAAYPYVTSGEQDTARQFREYSELKRLLSAYENKHMITRLHLYVPSTKIYAGQSAGFYSFPDLAGARDANGQASNAPGTHWRDTYKARIYETGLTNLISCQVALASWNNYERIVTVLQLDIEETRLSRVFDAGISSAEQIYLVNAQGTIVSHPDASKIGLPGLSAGELALVTSASEVNLDGRQSNHGDLVAATRLGSVGWYLVMRVPASAVYGTKPFTLDLTRVMLILAVFAVFVIGLILMYSIIARSTVVRINNAIDTLNQEGIENIPPLPAQELEGKSPLSVLEHNANRLVGTIRALLEKSFAAQIKARDYQLRALQAQINPHFLYNTLDTIKWMIMGDKKDDSVWMVNALSKYFRLSLSGGRNIVELSTELALIDAYIGIIRRRFVGRFVVTVEADKRTLHCQIPKLTLQPLVENALLHGILNNKGREGELVIRSTLEDNWMTVSVRDNGCGMPPEKIAQLLSEDGGGYGLYNVAERLRLFGGDIQVASEPDQGTVATIRLPARFEAAQPEISGT